MSILYLLTSPPPAIPGTDAVFQEVAHLSAAFGGESVNLFPLRRPSSRLPRELYGLHTLRELRRLEGRCTLDHIYFSVLYFFPVLRLLRNPIVYTVAASLQGQKKPANLARLKALHRIVVSNDRDARVLAEWGLTNCSVIPPGINASGLSPHPLPLGRELTLLMASAPWEPQQFELKGIDTLLQAAAKLPFLKLIFLWRGLLAGELCRRVDRLGIMDQVEIIDQGANVSDYLARAHATVLLAKRADIVKSYPHSLMKSLVAGKPVLVSQCIPMADYVRQHRCGIVADEVSAGSVASALETLKANYADLAGNAARVGADAFSLAAMVERYREVYGIRDGIAKLISTPRH